MWGLLMSGGLASLYIGDCVCYVWYSAMEALRVPSFASVSTSSLPKMHVCALTFLYSDFMLEPCDEVYYGGYEEFVVMVIWVGGRRMWLFMWY
jgi:hypothetical protein